jgi:hypothetical protein
MNKFKTLFTAGVGCIGFVAVTGLAQAIELTPVSTIPAVSQEWQNIGGTSYTFNDVNGNGQLNVGEKVTFIVDMQKTSWGQHDFDALKFWIDSSGTNLLTEQFAWDFNGSADNKGDSSFDHLAWNGGDKLFSFDYTFLATGIFNLTADVLCSDDLAKLMHLPQSDALMSLNWDAWQHNPTPSVYQGETKGYTLTVLPVPEPETYAMLLVGLGLLGFTARSRKSNNFV